MTRRESRRRIRNSIRALRLHNGDMTQQALADRVGITRQTVIAMEQNRYAPSLETAFLIAEAFGAPLEAVFHFSVGDTDDSE
jgi:putative transcriptional regulator